MQRSEWLRELTHWSLQFRNSPGYYGVSRIIPHMGNEEMCYRILSSCNMPALASVSQAFEQRGRVISSSPTPDQTHTHTNTGYTTTAVHSFSLPPMVMRKTLVLTSSIIKTKPTSVELATQ